MNTRERAARILCENEPCWPRLNEGQREALLMNAWSDPRYKLVLAGVVAGQVDGLARIEKAAGAVRQILERSENAKDKLCCIVIARGLEQAAKAARP